MNEIPNFRSIVIGEFFFELNNVIIIFAWHIPSRPSINIKVEFLYVDCSNGLWYDWLVIVVVFVNRVYFACLGVTFEEFLWDVLAGSEHVDGVVAEVGDGS